MTSEVFTIFGSSKVAYTSGACSGAVVTSGYLNLASQIWTDSSGQAAWTSGFAPNTIRVPKGTALKIWEDKVAIHGGVGHVQIDMSTDSGASYRTISQDTCTDYSGGVTQVMVRRTARPLVIQSPEGDTLVRFTFVTDAGTGGIFAEYNAEIVELNQ